MPRTITRQILLAAAVSFVAALVVLAVAAPLLAQDHDRQALDAWLTSEANLVGDLARDGLRARDPGLLDPLAHRLGASAGIRVTLIAPDGLVLGESDEDRRTMENHAERPEVAAAFGGAVGNVVRHSDTVGRDLLYIAVPVRDGSALVGVARTALPLTALQSLAAKLGALIVVVGVAASLAALLALVILARAITRPIRTLTVQAEALAGGTPSDFAVGGPAEVERLGSALRRMAATITGQRANAETERDRLAVLIDELSDAIVIADAGGRIVLANRSAAQSLGPAAAQGHELVEAVGEHEVLDAVRRARIGAEEIAQIERSDPPRFARALARRLADGQLLLVIQDLTNLRRLETVRRDFVANVSHELRTPIASLKAMTETLEGGALADASAARDFLGRMHQEIDALAQLVEELLLLGGIESGQLPLRVERVSASDLLTRARDRFATLAARSGVHLTLDSVPPTLPDIKADPERIAQVFANLIHNAVRYTRSGGEIHLSAQVQEPFVAFAVRDTGHGISSADLDRIFERFYKGDRARASGGTGLGLAIAKHIVLAHGGQLTAQSAGEGRGSTFRFTLPRSDRT